MAVETLNAPSPASRKIRRLGIAVAVVVALYSAGWFYVASKFETAAAEFLAASAQDGVSVTCDRLSTGGFPFLIGFTCDRTGIDDRRDGHRLDAGAFRIAARIYNPGSAIVELEGPATLALADGGTARADWTRLRSSLRAGFSGLGMLSLEGEAPSLQFDSPLLAAPLSAKASKGEFHIRENQGDLDIALMGLNFELGSGGTEILPTLSTSVDLMLTGRGGVLSGAPLFLRNSEGELRALRIETPDGLFGDMSGPFTIDAEGYLTGTFRTTFERIDLWDATLRRIFPEAGDTISGLAALLKGLAKGGDKVTVTLEVDKGRISLSLLPLGRIPPI